MMIREYTICVGSAFISLACFFIGFILCWVNMVTTNVLICLTLPFITITVFSVIGFCLIEIRRENIVRKKNDVKNRKKSFVSSYEYKKKNINVSSFVA